MNAKVTPELLAKYAGKEIPTEKSLGRGSGKYVLLSTALWALIPLWLVLGIVMSSCSFSEDCRPPSPLLWVGYGLGVALNIVFFVLSLNFRMKKPDLVHYFYGEVLNGTIVEVQYLNVRTPYANSYKLNAHVVVEGFNRAHELRQAVHIFDTSLYKQGAFVVGKKLPTAI